MWRTRAPDLRLIGDALAVQQLALIVEKREGGWSMTVPSMVREVIEEESGRDRPPASDRGRLAPPAASALERHAGAQTGGHVPHGARSSRPQRPQAPRTLARAREERQAPLDRRRRPRPGTCRALPGARDDRVAAAHRRLGEESAIGATTRGATRGNTASSPNR